MLFLYIELSPSSNTRVDQELGTLSYVQFCAQGKIPASELSALWLISPHGHGTLQQQI